MIKPCHFLLVLFAALPSYFFVQADDETFTTLFDGSSLEGWKQSGNWVIAEDGSLFRKEKGGGISYSAAKVPDDFELQFEWKVAERTNSGVYYRPTQYEYQILDNKTHPDGKNPRTSAASLYFCMAPCCDLTKPVGEWNVGKIVAKGSVVQHWLNGQAVISFDYDDAKWKEQVGLLTKRGGNLEARGANLSLQDHGDPVWYRNIRIREIPQDEVVVAGDVAPVALGEEVLAAEKKKVEAIAKRREEASRQAAKAKK
ncbi:DUF1080 domain-containing protein [Verrucomicrobiales bacterium]|jgi:hypothetical protein|nr:DUF1080 domain-containing protein [Verrucomicrobiales bacterium]MDA7926619.1 DUF1080 domain-containing protein [Verrucomicrobiales bacterium]